MMPEPASSDPSMVKSTERSFKDHDDDDVPLSHRLNIVKPASVTNGSAPSEKPRKPSILSSKKPSKPASPIYDDDIPLSKKVASMKESPKDDDDVPLAVKAKKIKEGSSTNGNGTKIKALKAEESKTKKVVKVDSKKEKRPPTAAAEEDEDDIPLAKKMKQLSVKNSTKNGLSVGEGDEESSNWWEEGEYQQQDNTVKWTSLEHNGVCFPPEYVPHKVPLIYDGQEIILEPEAEEVAGFFGALIQTDHAQNEIFIKNFFEDFCQVLRSCNSQYASLIKDFGKCDFSLMHQHFERLKEKRKLMTKDDKEKIKAEKAALIEKFGFCMIDGRKERIGNFMVEPPGLFRGRGKHPKAGKLKTRVRPEQITINIGPGSRIPTPPEGHHWGAVQHDNTVTWLATWVENINKAQKYVFLAPESSLKGKSDMEKFEKARKLKVHVKRIRSVNAEELRSKEMMVRQRATALWLIDHLALRAGNEKGDDEADTVGCCSLRCEHVQLVEPNIVVFDFLGKDSIRYYNEVPVDAIIFKNLKIFMRPPKTPNDPIFDRLTTSDLNKYLSSLMPGLTAKVFRTYNASSTFQEELGKTPAEGDTAQKILAYNRANRQVAILCNHQKSVSKNFNQSMDNMKRKILHIKYQRYLCKLDLKELLGSNKLKKELPEALEPESDLDDDTISSLQKELAEKETQKAAKKSAAKALEAGEAPLKDATTAAVPSLPESPAKKRTLSQESLQKKLANLTVRIKASKLQLIDKDENKTTALGTSKTNYIDPRITVSWCAEHEVPVEKLFPQTLRKKFQWAMNVPKTWKF